MRLSEAMRDDIYVGSLFSEDYLMHHGIKGQKWGVKHGPPYPLDSSVSKRVKSGKDRRTAGNKKSANDDPHNKKGNNLDAYKLALNIALDAIMLNPIGAAQDAIRLGQYVSSKYKSNQVSKRQATEDVDKKTGFHKKNRVMSMDEDVKNVNPNFHNFNSNTKNNCMLCTVTYDMRRRGYDVTAELAGKGYTYDSVKQWYPKAKIVDVRGANQSVARTTMFGDKQLMANTKREIEKQPNGARGNLMVQWSNFQGGHSMAYEVIDGKMHIFDGQTGTHYTNPDKVLKHCYSVSYARLDNIEPNYKRVKECCK